MTTARIVLTARDRQLLEHTYRFRLLSRDQIMALTHFKSLTRANTRLAKLVKAKLLSRKQTPVVPGHGGAQSLYYLASGSTAVLKTDPGSVLAQSRQAARWDLRQVEHVITANQALGDFLSAVSRLPDAQLLSFRTEPELRRAFLGQPLVPDGWFAWAEHGKRFNCFVEVDLAHEGLTQWRKKVLDYLTYAESGLHQEMFSFRSFRVLVLAESGRKGSKIFGARASTLTVCSCSRAWARSILKRSWGHPGFPSAELIACHSRGSIEMKFCRNCRKFNAGEPMRCRYCRAGLTGRLCPRNHVNPVDANVAFCGDCGQPLERECGAGSAGVIGGAMGVLIVIIVLLVVLSSPHLQQELFSMLIVFGLLIVALRFLFGLLPSWAQQILGSAMRGIVNLVAGTGNKGKGA